ncbi:hypothetical protein BH23CHL9_BH23CHL9_01970 [soil metagenome]
MSGASRLLIALAVAGSSLLLAGRPASVRAADDDGTQVLTGQTAVAITGDVDGDGVRELVRVMVDPTNASRFVIEALAHDGDQWSSMGTAVVARHNEDQTVRVPIETDSDGFGLLAWNDGDGERILLVTGGRNVTGESGCCLTTFGVRVSDGRLGVVPLSGTFGDADAVAVLDLDGDGVDELLVVEPFRTSGDVQVRVLRWNGSSGFDGEIVPLPDGGEFGLYLSGIGDSDGVPGDEVIFGPTDDGRLFRLGAAADGQITVEETDGGPVAIGSLRYVASATAGRLTGMTGDAIHVLRWPRGSSMEIAASLPVSEQFALSMLGEGEHAVIVDASMGLTSGEPEFGTLVYDLDLEPVLDLPADAATSRFVELTQRDFPALSGVSHNVYPHVGSLPGGLGDGREAYFIPGRIIVLDSAGELTVQPTSGMVNAVPVGVAGPDDGWMALSTQWPGDKAMAYLYPSGSSATITMTPIDNVLTDAPADGLFAPELRGAFAVEGSAGVQRLVAPDGGFTAMVDAPPGSLVVAASGVSISYQGEVEDGPLSVEIAPDREREGNQEFDAAILVITPAGAAASVSWEVEILREPPELTTSAQTDAFALHSTIIGRASDGADITFDGRPVQAAGTGGFRAEVDAPIWPRDVVVVARDPLGNETVRRLEVVGFLDYRGLPWVPIVGVVTVAFGILMFVRTPRHRPAVLLADGDGRLEEIDGDPDRVP